MFEGYLTSLNNNKIPSALSVGLMSQSASELSSPCCRNTGRFGPLVRDTAVRPYGIRWTPF